MPLAAIWLAPGLTRAPAGTCVAVGMAYLAIAIGNALIGRKAKQQALDEKESYRRRKGVLTLAVLLAAAAMVILWALLLNATGTFLGLVVAGLAVATKEPLLAIAGRLSILGGRVYAVGDSNWVQLMLRYLVHPRSRRAAKNFIWERALAAI